MNIVVFITDQERAIQHFPRDWARRNLPGLTRLQRHGLTFENAFCNSCMCSPSRATLMTGYFPAQHGVKYTLEDNMADDEFPQVELPLPPGFQSLASVMSAAGYSVVYKGKWHLSKPAGSEFAPSDLAPYGFARWNPPDAGASQDLDQSGGGTIDNDGRFMNQQGSAEAGDEGVLQYLTTVAKGQQPFFLVVSLVNPHDVLLYPKSYLDGGYDDSWLEGDLELPATVDEDLSTKPIVQREWRALMNAGSGRLNTHQKKLAYVNFYGNLLKACDAYVVDVLNTLASQNLLDDTLVIRTSDHGEMGLSHGTQRQKNFNVYEETLRVPLVYSNPRLWSRPAKSQVMVSHVDFLPTLASLVNAPASARANWQGVDYSDHILERLAPPPQDYVVFTYDDWQAGQSGGLYVTPPQHIVSLRERRWKIAEYYDANGKVPSQWEMYDLKQDPLERHNLAHRGYKRTPAQEKQYQRLRRKLARVKAQRLRALPNTPQPETQGSRRIAPPQATD
jgi:arylsulfatase A-like enzyme